MMEGWLACASACPASARPRLPRLARLPDTLPRVRRPLGPAAELAGSVVRLLLASRALSSIAGVGGSGVGSAWHECLNHSRAAIHPHTLLATAVLLLCRAADGRKRALQLCRFGYASTSGKEPHISLNAEPLKPAYCMAIVLPATADATACMQGCMQSQASGCRLSTRIVPAFLPGCIFG